MAAAAHVTAGIYGTIAGAPPYVGTDSGNAFNNFYQWKTPVQMSFPTTGTLFHEVTPGQRVGSNYIYSIIEVQATGASPQPQSQKYASNVSVATLATNAG
jgi:hypothetical protein